MHREGLTELIPPPRNGRLFAGEARAGLADCAPSGRARLDALARWLQDVAYADVEDAGVAEAAVWVVRRTRIAVARFPRFGERCALRTFCSGFGRAWAERRTTIAPADHDGPAVEAVSLWVHLDPSSMQPAPLTPKELEVYGDAAAGRRVRARLHHPAPPAGGPRRSWTFRATECDLAGHVNNAAYWQPLEEELLTTADPQWTDVEMEFRNPAQPGEKLILRDGERRWIVSGDGDMHASAVLAQPSVGSAVSSAS